MVQAANWKGGRLWSFENGNSGSVGGVAGLRWLSEQLNKRQRRTKNSRTGEGVQGDGPKAEPRSQDTESPDHSIQFSSAQWWWQWATSNWQLPAKAVQIRNERTYWQIILFTRIACWVGLTPRRLTAPPIRLPAIHRSAQLRATY